MSNVTQRNLIIISEIYFRIGSLSEPDPEPEPNAEPKITFPPLLMNSFNFCTDSSDQLFKLPAKNKLKF